MRKMPLFIITGASGTGKTTVTPLLRKLMPEIDVFDMDIIQNVDWQVAKHNWLRIAYSISLSCRCTILCGTMTPENLETCDHKEHFSHICYLNLHCDDQTRNSRLKARNWDDDLIYEHLNFAKWLINNAEIAFDPPMPTIDTTNTAVEEVANQIMIWVNTYK